MKKHTRIASLLILICVIAMPVAAQNPGRAGHFLTQEKSSAAPRDIAMQYIHERVPGLSAADLSEMEVRDQHTSKRSGTTHIYLTQKLNGIEVVNAQININIARDGRVINMGNSFVSGLKAAARSDAPSVSAAGAIQAAAEHLGLKAPGSLIASKSIGGPSQEVRFSSADLSLSEIPAKLVYYALEDGRAVLAWDLQIHQLDQQHWWNLWVDAATGKVLGQSDWIDSDTYEVFAVPKDSPLDGPRTIEANPADAIASPFGWHDTDGSAGAEFTDTRGNNVFAQEDRDNNNTGGFRPAGGASLDFQFPLDLATESPVDYQDAAIANLFYVNNALHDILFYYGFDEASGNFQQNNYTGAAGGGDPVQADAQDGSGTNNANFGTPPDGSDPRMQMFEWTPIDDAALVVNSPVSIAGNYVGASAGFGAPLTVGGFSGDLELVDDGTANGSEGCNALTGFTSGRIAVIDRGSCEFGTKVLNAENAGAIAAVVINNTGTGVIAMGPGAQGDSVTIEAMMLSLPDGNIIKPELGNGVNGTIQEDPNKPPNRDSDFDNGIIAHELCHGVSNRLTGGRTSVNCLTNQQQAGEGWSDFCALAFTANGADTATTARGVGTYVSYQSATGPGIRDFPYSTDLGTNPHTYEDIGSVSVPHGVGSVWNIMLWEVYWNLTDTYGFDSDLYNGVGGNNLAIQLVIDGLKLQPCNPTFIEARDAVLAADNALTGGANQCRIWEGFAKRGLGAGATDGGGGLVVTNDFTLPAACQDLCGNGACQPEFGEDCNTCPSDCDGGTSSGASCGNGICETGPGDDEDCISCPQDCNGTQGGKPSNRFCCGPVPNPGTGPVDCNDSRCGGPSQCTFDPAPSGNFCCGDLTCQAAESCAICGVDCAVTEVGACANGEDDNCDGNVDCDDFFCRNDPACASTGGSCGNGVCDPGEDCTTCSDCDGRTGGKPSNRFCCGNGIAEGPEGGGAICDGNF